MNIIRAHCLGGLSQGSHLFPFRTEKLSPVEPMILLVGKVGSCQDCALDLSNTQQNSTRKGGFLYGLPHEP